MTETQKRIKAYKKALPHMKERVTAVAMLLVIAVAMMTSATFAWMTLSRSPEASSMFTTVTTNGNLEIALSGPDGMMPLESAIGDGSRDIMQKNLTWGNLINLSDVRYGLKDIVLRPASLNPTTLATNPMHAVQYGSDGRVTGYLYDFMYSNYIENPETGAMYFSPEDVIKYGVRAISTVTFGDATGDAMMIRKIEQMQANLIEAQQSFKSIYDVQNSAVAKDYMQAVGGLVGVHVDKTVNGGTPDAAAYMQGLYELSNAFMLCVVDMGEVIVEGANLCVFMSLEKREEYDQKAFTFEDLINGDLTNETIEERCGGKYSDINFTCIEDFRTLWKKMAGYDGVLHGVNDQWKPTDENGVFVEKITLPSYNSNYASPVSNSKSIYGAYEVILAKYQDYQNRVMNSAADQTVKWDNWMIMAVNQMCDMDSATIRAGNRNAYTAAELLQLKSEKNLGELTPFAGDGPFYAMIHDGAIQDAGQLLGKAMDVPSNDQIRVKADILIASLNYTFKIDMKPSIAAAYDVNGNVLATDIEEAKRLASGGSDYRGDPMAAETYAMVFDFWIRTNVQNTLLTLEGDLIYNQKAGTNSQGQKVGLLFSYLQTDPETGAEVSHYVYLDQGKYYYDFEKEGVNDQLTDAQLNAIREKLQIVYEEKPSGYEGVNRVWDQMNDPNNDYMQNVIQHNGVSATQGSGSCYIFYPQSMEDHQQSLKLLGSMRVAFVDANGTLLATAYMDTANAIENAGRVIVPLRLRNNDTPIVDANGETVTEYITPLMKNEAKRVSAIVYLEGDNLKNSEVLSAGSITGQMNIQFGTTDVKMNPVEDSDVMEKYYTFDFSLDGNRDNNIDSSEEDNDYEMPAGAERIVDLYLELGGSASPSIIEGNFVAVINATQGARQKTFEMRKNEATGIWEAYTYDEVQRTYVKGVFFSGPGNYQLRSIRIDGVDYMLNNSQFVKVQIPGMAVSALQWSDTLENSKQWRTAESQWQETLKLRLESDDNKAHKVQGVFLGDNGKNVTVTFSTEDKVNYEGTATFSAGGMYKLTYVYIDDELTPVDESMYKQIQLQLGLQVEIGYSAPQIMQSEMRLPDDWDSYTEEEKQEYIADILQDLTVTPKLCYFRYNRLAPLTMEVWCKVYDDMDKELTELQGLELYFGTGGNPLDADLTWNPDTERYEGQFVIRMNGIYNFSYLLMDDDSTITKAVSSMVIQSASPDPVYYVHHMNQYPEVSYNLGLPANQRVLQFKLKNSQGAAIKVALNNTPPQAAATIDDTEEEQQYLIIDNMDERYRSWWTESQPDGNGVVTYTLTLPSDGYWEIVGLYLGGGAYYDGQIWSGETDADWADLSELVQSDNIKTYYLTQVNITATGLPSNTTVEFMQHKKGDNDTSITIKVENQGRPLAQVLEEVAAMFPEAGIDPTVEIKLEYGYNAWANQKWTAKLAEGKSLPMTINGGKMENGEFTMNVKLTTEGNYTPNFSLKISGKPYTGTIPERLTATKGRVEVRWEQPTVVVDSVSPAAGQTFSTTQNSGGVWTEVAGVSNYISSDKDYAAVYLSASKNTIGKWNYSTPSVTLLIDKDGEGTAKLTMVNAADKNTSHVFNFSTSTGKATASIGRVSSSSVDHDTKYLAGKTTFTAVTKTCDAGEFTLPLQKSVTVEQPEAPYMLSFGNVPMSIPENQRPKAVMANGSEVTVYLPKLTWTETWTEDPVYGEWSSWSAPKTIRTDYNTRSWTFIITYTRYNYFIWGEYSRTRSATGATMEQKKQIQKWIINGQEYEAGLTYTIQLDGNAIASAVITDVAPAYSVGSKTITETDYAYGYQASSTDQKNTPAGGKNISSDNKKPKLFSDGYMYEDINGYEAAWP